MALITKFPSNKKRIVLNMEAVNGFYDPLESLYDNNDEGISGFAVLLNINGYAEIKFSLNMSVTIFAISSKYGDSGGSSGKNMLVYKKQDDGSYTLFKEVSTHGDNDGWYELMKLDKGDYWLKAGDRYVTFTEWYVVENDISIISINSNSYIFNTDGNFRQIEPDKFIDADCDLELINKNKDNLLKILNANKFKIQMIKK